MSNHLRKKARFKKGLIFCTVQNLAKSVPRSFPLPSCSSSSSAPSWRPPPFSVPFGLFLPFLPLVCECAPEGNGERGGEPEGPKEKGWKNPWLCTCYEGRGEGRKEGGGREQYFRICVLRPSFSLSLSSFFVCLPRWMRMFIRRKEGEMYYNMHAKGTKWKRSRIFCACRSRT